MFPSDMSVKQVLENFANQTTMHGVPKVIHSRNNLTRFFWSVVCIAAGAMFCMQMSEVLRRYFSYPKKVTVEVVPTPVPFPAVSLCNMRNLDIYILNTLNRKFIEDHHPINHINSSAHPFVREYMKIVAKYGPIWYNYQSHYPLVFQEVFSRTTFSSNIPEEIISLAGVQLDEFVVNCYYSGNKCNRTRDFTRFFDPYYYNCFTYTPNQYQGEDENTILSLSEGIENGWSSIVLTGSGMLDKNDDIRVLPGLHESHSAVSASEGVRVVIHPPDTQPFPFTEGYDVPPGFSASFGIRPRRNIRVGPPYGNCSMVNPFGTTTKRYRGISCQKMCLQSHVMKTCDCYDVSLPKMPQMNKKPCRENDRFPDSCMHNGTKECMGRLIWLDKRIQCARDTRDLVTKNTTTLERCMCYPPCDEVFYDVSYSLSKWPATGYEGDAAYHDVFYIENFKDRFIDTVKYEKVDAYFNDSNRETTMRDFARLNVYVADSNVIKTQESPDYGSNQLVSDIGGQLGLWVGISLITLTEVLELLCELFRYFCSAKLKPANRSMMDVNGARATQQNVRNGKYKPPPRLELDHVDAGEGQGDTMLGFYYEDSRTSTYGNQR